MKWPFRHKAEPVDFEGKALAKSQLEVARVIESEAQESAHEHRFLLYTNHFGLNTARAMREGRRK